MEFVSVRDLRGRSASIWRKLPKERYIVITSKGKPIAILTPTSSSELEESLSALRAARALQAVASMQMKAQEEGLDKTTLQEVNDIISKVRKERN
jgi:antitoxin (DNA-binding transcriptional repressor) of toxin-antitoxin stability system